MEEQNIFLGEIQSKDNIAFNADEKRDVLGDLVYDF